MITYKEVLGMIKQAMTEAELRAKMGITSAPPGGRINGQPITPNTQFSGQVQTTGTNSVTPSTVQPQVQPPASTPAPGSVPAQGYDSTNPPPQNAAQSMGEYSQDEIDRFVARVNNTPVAVENGKRIINENIVAPIRQSVQGAVGAVNSVANRVQSGINTIGQGVSKIRGNTLTTKPWETAYKPKYIDRRIRRYVPSIGQNGARTSRSWR